MTPLQKAVEMNQVELVNKYVKVFGLDVNGVTPQYNLERFMKHKRYYILRVSIVTNNQVNRHLAPRLHRSE